MRDQVILHTRKIWGKFIGFFLGLLLGGPWGAFLGLVIGSFYDSQKEKTDDVWSDLGQHPSDFAAQVEQATFTMGVIVLSAKMAKSDGRITRAEIDAFKRVFQIPPSQEQAVGSVFDRARRSATGFEPYALRMAQVFRNRPSVLEAVLSGLFIIAAADTAGLTAAEIEFLKRVSFLFGFGPDDFARIAARSGVALPSSEKPRASMAEPYVVLGVAETATAAEIKTAYFALIRKHHPDKLMAQGVPPEYIATATEKMKRINAAYDSICKIRGIK